MGKDMSKPVAWMQTWQNQDGELKQTVNIEQIGKNDIPLYTHPVELTDELLMKLYELADYCPETYLEEAKAILRKARE